MKDAMKGALAADTLAMPVHWYYDTAALDRDYGSITEFLAPKNPHPDSILWRSRYTPRNSKGDILHDQGKYWGKRGIHYHQFLRAGENTVNFKLGAELFRQVTERGSYDADRWLDRYIEVMRTPGWHGDTYVEEYHRAFFDNLAQGKRPRGCGIDDVHIGGLTSVPFLVAALVEIGERDEATIIETVLAHLELTHRNREVRRAGKALSKLLLAVARGDGLRTVLSGLGAPWGPSGGWEAISQLPDRQIVGRHFSPACYLPASFSASLALVFKYSDDFTLGIQANAECGGDNCHRGAIVGSLLGLANGTTGFDGT